MTGKSEHRLQLEADVRRILVKLATVGYNLDALTHAERSKILDLLALREEEDPRP